MQLLLSALLLLLLYVGHHIDLWTHKQAVWIRSVLCVSKSLPFIVVYSDISEKSRYFQLYTLTGTGQLSAQQGALH